ncbi:MAG: methyltransferase domain-containing protein [Kofleriaceae bacterium]
MDWRVKGVIQKVLGGVRGGDKLHFLLQRRAGALRHFERECDIKVDDWRLMMGHLRASNLQVMGASFFEIGTGWYPAFPLLLYLAGAARIDTVDLTAHLRGELVVACVERLGEHLPLIDRLAGSDPTMLVTRHTELLHALYRGDSLAEATHGVIAYRAPCDASATGLPDAMFDCVFSNSVLEHIPRDGIAACFIEARRILKPEGIVFHSVNCGDHYAYADRTIDQLHYLKYSEAAWGHWNNRFLYQNRLRAMDFTRLAAAAGFELEIDTSRPHPDRLRQLDAIDVDPMFAHYSREQLAITSVDFVARQPVRARIAVPHSLAPPPPPNG